MRLLFVWDRLLEEVYIVACGPRASAVRDTEGMNKSRRDQLRSPFKPRTSSSSSLNGMEKPIRSFRSFIKAVPPHPSENNKPLPPTPLEKSKNPPSQTTDKIFSERRPSASGWKPPAERENKSARATDLPQTPSSTIPNTRTYSLLLPEPSHDIAERMIEVASHTDPRARSPLMPIYERKNSDLGAPTAPPRSPLPRTPTASPNQGRKSPRVHRRPVASPGVNGNEVRHNAISMDNGTRKIPHQVTTSQSTGSRNSGNILQEKASEFLGVDSSADVPTATRYPYAQDNPSIDQSNPATWHRQREKHLRRTGGESPLTDDWEEQEMDDRMRLLSFSQDYHGVLMDQYRNTVSRSPIQEVKKGQAESAFSISSEPQQVGSRIPPQSTSHELIPRPLSWQKTSSNGSTPRRNSRQDQNINKEDSSFLEADHTKKEKKLSFYSWVPRRLSIGANRERNGSSQTEPIHSSNGNNPTIHYPCPIASTDDINRQKQSNLKKSLFPKNFYANKQDYNFLHSRRSRSAEGKDSKHESGNNRQHNIDPAGSPIHCPFDPPNDSDSPILRLPGPFAVIRTSPPSTKPSSQPSYSRSPSEPRSPIGVHPTGGSPFGGSPSISEQAGSSGEQSPQRQQSQRGSYNSFEHATLGVAKVVAGQRIERLSRSSGGTGSVGTGSSPLGNEVRLSSENFGRASRDGYHSGRKESEEDERGEWKKPSLIERMQEARRRRTKAHRQEKLKQSIRVLGPTDPSVVEGYVKQEDGSGGRLPGYLR